MKVIVDAKNDCVFQSYDGAIPYSPNITSIDIREFGIKANNGSIHIGLQPIINPPDKDIDPDYYTNEMIIFTDGKIRIEDNAVSLLKYKKILSIVLLCNIADKNKSGVKFIALN